MTVSKRIEIKNLKGLHARAAGMFAKEAGKYKAKVEVIKDGQKVSANSVMGLMMLCAFKGTRIEIISEGEEEAVALRALVAIIERKFDEE